MLGNNTEVYVTPKPRHKIVANEENSYILRCIPSLDFSDVCMVSHKMGGDWIRIRKLKLDRKKAEDNYPSIYARIRQGEGVMENSIVVPRFIMEGGGIEIFDNLQ
jgi:hypothetical protein